MTDDLPSAHSGAQDDAAIAEAAAEWFLRVREGDLGSEQLSAWLQWLEMDPRHAVAFDEIEAAWHGTCRIMVGSDLVPAADEVAADAYDGTGTVAAWRERAGSPPVADRAPQDPARLAGLRRRWRLGLGLAASLVAVALLVSPPAGWLPGDPVSQRLVLETAFGENRTFELRDGSRVDVGGKSLLLVTFGPTRRDVSLERGEAFFSVAKDPRRPFTVRAGDTDVTAVGTAFNVRRTGERVVVAVAEGVVKVAPGASDDGAAAATGRRPPARIARLRAGERAIVEGSVSRTARLSRVDASQVDGWRVGRLQYENEPLASVVADLSRYSRRGIEIGDAEVGALRLTATVFKDQDEAWLESLQAALPVRAIEQPDGTVRLEAAPRP